MAEGRAVPEPLKHPDPHWWEALEPIGVLHTVADICRYCGHVRFLHTNGCRAPSTSLMGNPRECDCTNTAVGNLYLNPRTYNP